MVRHEKGLAFIAEIHRAVHALGLAMPDATSVTQAEALVLMLLYAKGSAPLDAVHKTFLHRRSTLTNVLERLERRKLVCRRASALDRRRFDISLTASGRRKAKQIVTLFSTIIEASGISEGEAAASRATLAKIVDAASTLTF